MEIRNLRADEILCRVSRETDKGVALLLYKDSRVDQNILDETFGPENWQKEFYECKGNLFCRVGIRCGDEWGWKSDCGSESNVEAEKGEASDAFKRACFNWGIGRELYTAPFIWIPAGNYSKNQKGECADNFKVTRIEIKDKKIVGLEITSKSHKVVYSWPTSSQDAFKAQDNKVNSQTAKTSQRAPQPPIEILPKEQSVKQFYELCASHEKDPAKAASYFHVKDDSTQLQWHTALYQLKEMLNEV